MSVNPLNNDLMVPLPDELVVDVLRELPPADLHACTLVSQRLNRLVRVVWKDLIKEQCGAQCFGVLSQLVDQGWMTWGEAYRHREALASLVSTWMREELSTSERILEKNPQLVPILADANTPDKVQQRSSVGRSPEIRPSHLIPRPVVAHKDAIFSVVNCSDVEMKDEKGKKVLKGEPGTLINCLAHDGRDLYVLREDGWVLRWNPETDTNSKIQTISCTKLQAAQESRLRSLNDEHFSNEDKDLFLCKEGFIVIRHIGFVEVIEIEIEPRRSEMIYDPLPLMHRRYLIQDKKLYAVGNRTDVWNLENGERIQEIQLGYATLSIYATTSISNYWMTKDSLFAYGIHPEARNPHIASLLQFSLRQGILIDSFAVDLDCTGCAVVGRFLFRRPTGFISQKTAIQKFHFIFDMRTGKVIGNIDLVVNPVSGSPEIHCSIHPATVEQEAEQEVQEEVQQGPSVTSVEEPDLYLD